jgi:hypothetical protein
MAVSFRLMVARKSRCMCWFIAQYVETKLHCNGACAGL